MQAITFSGPIKEVLQEQAEPTFGMTKTLTIVLQPDTDLLHEDMLQLHTERMYLHKAIMALSVAVSITQSIRSHDILSLQEEVTILFRGG